MKREFFKSYDKIAKGVLKEFGYGEFFGKDVNTNSNMMYAYLSGFLDGFGVPKEIKDEIMFSAQYDIIQYWKNVH